MKLYRRTANIGENRLAYWSRKVKSTKWIVFLHGAGMDSKMFAEQLQMVSNQYNVLLWDARGHGESDNFLTGFSIRQQRNDLLHVLTLEDCNQAIFVGQSMGGNLIQDLAYHHPDMVQKMILIGCTWNTNRVSLWEKLAIKATPVLLKLYPWSKLLQQSASACGMASATREYVMTSLSRLGKKRFVEVIYATMQVLKTDTNYRFNKPILLLCGRNDKTGNIQKAVRQWERSEPLCSLHMIENAAHNANQDNPESVNTLIAAFL